MNQSNAAINPRYAYQALATAMLRTSGRLTNEAERGVRDALDGKLYRDSATERKDPTVRAEYDNGWEIGRWIKIDKRPQPAITVSHDFARDLNKEFATTGLRRR